MASAGPKVLDWMLRQSPDMVSLTRLGLREIVLDRFGTIVIRDDLCAVDHPG